MSEMRYLGLINRYGNARAEESNELDDLLYRFYWGIEENEFHPVAIYDRFSGSLFLDLDRRPERTLEEWKSYFDRNFSLDLPIARLVPIDWEVAYKNTWEVDR